MCIAKRFAIFALSIAAVYTQPAISMDKFYQPGYYDIKPGDAKDIERLELPHDTLEATEGKPIPPMHAILIMTLVVKFADSADLVLRANAQGKIAAIKLSEDLLKPSSFIDFTEDRLQSLTGSTPKHRLLTVWLDRSFVGIEPEKITNMQKLIESSSLRQKFSRILIVQDRSAECKVVVADFESKDAGQRL